MFDVAHHSFFLFSFFLFSFQILIACTFSCDKSMSQKDHPSNRLMPIFCILSGENLNRYILFIQPNFEDPATEKGDLARRLKFAIHLKHRSV